MDPMEWSIEAAEILRRLEWSGMISGAGVTVPACPICGGYVETRSLPGKGGKRISGKNHDPRCRLKRLLESQKSLVSQPTVVAIEGDQSF